MTDAEGRELGRVTGPPSLVDSRHPGAAAAVVAALVREALGGVGGRVAGTEPTALRGVRRHPAREGREPAALALHAALAGAGRESTRSAVERALQEEGVAALVRVGTDVEAAFHDAFGAGPGILLLAGTGSMAWGRSEDGEEGRVGGWGRLLGDEGSGWWIGLAGLRAVARAVDGRGPSTRLVDAVTGGLGLGEPEEIIPWVEGASKSEVASLVRVVRAAAEAGDEVAGALLTQAAEVLAGQAGALARRLGPWREPPPVALAGGLLEPEGILRAPVEALVEAGGARVVDRDPDPVRGAASLARAAWTKRAG